ncbi:Metastasis suppressor protein 1 [Sparganum proliferum]
MSPGFNAEGETVGYSRSTDEQATSDEKDRMPNPPVPPRSSKTAASNEDGDGATSEDATEDGDDDERDEEEEDDEEAERRARSHLQRRHTLGPAMERSILYPNQVLPPPVYANFDQLQKAAAQRLGTESRTGDQSSASETPTTNASSKPCTPTRKYSQPSPKVSSPGLSLLRNLSINGGEPTTSPSGLDGGSMEEGGAGEGLSMSPPQLGAAPIASDSTSCFMQARSRIDAMFASSHATLRGIKSGWRHPVAAGSLGDPCAGDSVAAETVSLGNPEPTSSLTPPPPPCIDQFAPSTSQQQQQQQQQSIPSGTMTVKRRVAGISRGSMLHLDRHMMASSPGPQNGCETGATTGNPSGAQGRFAGGGQPTSEAYGFPGMVNAPMTPGPGRRQPSRGLHVTDHYGGEMQIRPPRRSSSMSRELPRVGLDPGNMNQYRVLPPGDYSTISRCNPSNSGGGGGVHRVSSQPFAGDAAAPHASPASPACRTATVGPAQASQIAAEAAKRRTTGDPGRSSVKVLPNEPPTTVMSRLPQRAPNAQLVRPSMLANKSQRMHSNQHHQQQPNFAYGSGHTVPPPQAFWGGRRTNVADEIDSTSFIDSSCGGS